MQLVCSSCKRNIVGDRGSTQFNCPECGKAKLIRCVSCREIAAKYSCPECGFTGPN
ncbi:MAG TPA: zinc finger domain-containing protein [Candidatus Nanoarchaeia archaeon]|nr:zinc finger domain-containing protein [Candidatus Nanoarchaeia archaeon]